ncbi:M20/M25/M40 family metallo-hydrolase [Flavobacteriaceae bacterium]|nr:M20/M25/M40 family metallo-hydrolase [Flavobacteriaceae bacterium]
MKKASTLSFFLLLAAVYFSFYNLMPRSISSLETAETEFSTERALVPLKEITKAPHYVGTKENKRVREFLIQQLKELDLNPEIQRGYVLNEKGKRMNQPVNIVAKIKGTESKKSLLVFSHYDSALTPSFGASDAGSGVVTILESLRAFKATGKKPKNDIIILFTDAEEVGLVGAKLFVREHRWAKDVALSLNFESRGSGGPSSMIVETNHGNKNLIKGFKQANPDFPLASSLLYSVYKMLPNDTDSTILREEGDIDGLFFAFIDDHFDYHTAGDNFERMDRNSLEHQGSYLMPLLTYFADADLDLIKSAEDHVYTNFPILKMINYPFDWVIPMILIAALLFIVLLFVGFKNHTLQFKSILKGFLPFLFSILMAFFLGFYGWKTILKIYPHYSEILHGFTYNGHAYIGFFVSFSLAICWFLYSKFQRIETAANLMVAPLIIWLVINVLIAFYLKGAAYFILPFYCALVSFWILIKREFTSVYIHLLLALPAVLIFSPLIQTFPVGLGLKTIVISTIFTVLLFGLILSVIHSFEYKQRVTQGFILVALGFFLYAHSTHDFSEDRKKPNSLLYTQSLEEQKAHWLTYDTTLDDWSKEYLGINPKVASSLIGSAARSKYNSGFTFASEAPFYEIPHYESTTLKDSVFGGKRAVTIKLEANKKADVLRLYVNQDINFDSLSYNGVEVSENLSYTTENNRLLTFYVQEQDALEISYTIAKDTELSFTLDEYSFDLMNNPWVKMSPRTMSMMPKPFVFNDALVVKQKITP